MLSHYVHCSRYSTFNSNIVYGIYRQSLRQENTDFYLAYGDGKEAEEEQESTHSGKENISGGVFYPTDSNSSTVLTAAHSGRHLWFPLSSITCTPSTGSTQ